MVDTPELNQKKEAEKELSDETSLPSSFGLRPSPEELASLNSVDTEQEIAKKVETGSTGDKIAYQAAEKEIIDKKVDKIQQEITLDTKIKKPDNIEELRADHAKISSEINAEVRKTFGQHSEVQQLEGRLEAWRTRNINQELDLEAEIKAQERAKIEEEKAQAKDQDKGKKKSDSGLWGLGAESKPNKSIIDLIVERILEILGLSEPKNQKSKNSKGKGKDGEEDKKDKKEPFLVRALRALGLIE
jgi:hypothetical protein